ncbi:MAG TPA: hypothetical protein VKT77_17695 [Chthonomonadaceae bacterium]|nr:hypothetical protein [Chthonomonadaceae bacterium]
MARIAPEIDLILARCSPSGGALLDWLRARVTNCMLREIADADYGVDYDDHLAALKSIRGGSPIPVPFAWCPREVLELKRWSEPDVKYKKGRKRQSSGRRRHLIRAFCCAVLIAAAGEPESAAYINSENATLAGLIESVLLLGRDAADGALRLVAWRLPRIPDYDEEAPFFALGGLLLRAALYDAGSDASELAALAAWVIWDEERARNDPSVLAVPDRWLFGLTLFDSRFETWRRLSRRILLAPGRFPEPAATALREIAERLGSSDRSTRARSGGDKP